jgi:hypothetical protein
MQNFPASCLYIALLFLSACTVTRHPGNDGEIHRLKFLSEYVVPFNKVFNNTIIGGLSGIDYDAENNLYYLISDDRSQENPVRFYTAAIPFHENKLDTVIFKAVSFLRDKMGNFYPNSRQDPSHTPDPEAMRLDPVNHTLVWSSEGERIVGSTGTVLENPAIIRAGRDGKYMDTFPLPRQFLMQATEKGPRQNGVFEGVTFDDRGTYLYVSTEEPLYPDGPRAGPGDTSGIVRIIKYHSATKKPVAQYAYRIDPVAYPPVTPSAFKVNGISDILWLGNDQMLVIERSYSTGRLACTIKVFLADISTAENIDQVPGLEGRPQTRLISKKLLLNMDTLGIFIDNIEGVTLGPPLSNGKRSLLFVADNNFSPLEKTQFLLFEID